MIDMKTLDKYSKYLNLTQICLLSGVNPSTIKTKLKRFRDRQNTKLTFNQSVQITEALRRLGITEIKERIR